MTTLVASGRKGPESDVDLYADHQLLDPWAGYRRLREQGGAVWLSRLNMYCLTRYADVKRALSEPETFSSGKGVMLNEQMNLALRGNTLCSDGAEHDKVRSVIIAPLTPKALRPLQPSIEQQAEDLVQRLVEQRSFDAAKDLAQYLPVTIVSNLVGLPEEGRERMLVWATEIFNCFGPDNERTAAALPVLAEIMDYVMTQAVPGKLKPGGWAQGIHDAARAGRIDKAVCPAMTFDYVAPSLDTTIFAITSAVNLFAENPDQWDIVREDPSLIPSAINEVLRLEAPIQGWTRYVERDTEVDGVTLPAGSRALLMWGAANRDPLEYADPDRFDVRRNSTGHLAFGHGVHACVGLNLAKLEMKALFGALAKRVRRFEVRDSQRIAHNVLRGFSKLDITVHE